MRFLSRLHPVHLVGASVAYWAALGSATLGQAVAAVWRATHLPPGQGTASLQYGNGRFTLATTEAGSPAWSGSTSLVTLILWVLVPPLVLCFAWQWERGRARRVAAAAPPARGSAVPGAETTQAVPPASYPQDALLRRQERSRANAPRAE